MRKLWVFIVFVLLNVSLKAQNRIEHHNKEIFLSGMNLAWVDYARDLTNFNESEFTRAMNEISDAGGNVIRWWLHVNGRYSPRFTNDKVSGLVGTEIPNLKRALDLAYERDIALILCLWSQNLLQPNAEEENYPRNKLLLEDPEYTQAYIDNALIPMVDSLKGHPAILCWEIFNEPEGMANDAHPWSGWTAEKVSFSAIQQFINLAAGAIHRTDTNALVSNGAWNVAVNTDVDIGGLGSVGNLYSDDKLIAAGGDPDGTLDFYMIHFYPDHGEASSPFLHPASYWELDKPIVVGEFRSDEPYTDMDPETAFRYLYDNGYAGALAWQWSAKEFGGLPAATPGIQYLFENYTDTIFIDYENKGINIRPRIIKKIPDTAVAMNSGTISNYVDLKKHFFDREDSTNLIFTIKNISDSGLVSLSISDSSMLNFTISTDSNGIAIINIEAADSTGKSNFTQFVILVYDPGAENKALCRKIWTSSIEDNDKIPAFAVDGDFGTRFSTEYKDNEWIIIEFDTIYTIERVQLYWETAYGLGYKVQFSEDIENWTDAYVEIAGNGEMDKIVFNGIESKYLKLSLDRRGTEWGFSLWEIEAYTFKGSNTAPVVNVAIENQTAIIGERFKFTVPDDAFSDSDEGDKLTYSWSLTDGNELPEWLNPNYTTETISGRPEEEDIGSIDIKVKAFDIFGESVSAEFTLTISYSSNISYENDQQILVYPIPANDYIIIKSMNNDPIEKIKIYNINAELIKIYDFNERLNEIRLQISNIPGMYYVMVFTDTITIKKLMIQ